MQNAESEELTAKLSFAVISDHSRCNEMCERMLQDGTARGWWSDSSQSEAASSSASTTSDRSESDRVGFLNPDDYKASDASQKSKSKSSKSAWRWVFFNLVSCPHLFACHKESDYGGLSGQTLLLAHAGYLLRINWDSPQATHLSSQALHMSVVIQIDGLSC